MLPGSRNTLLGNNVIIVFGTDVVSSRRSTLPRHSQYLKCTDWCLVSVCREWVETDKNGLLSITIRPHPPPINSLIIHSEISILEDRKFRNFQRRPPTRIFERTNVCTIDFVINNRSNDIPYRVLTRCEPGRVVRWFVHRFGKGMLWVLDGAGMSQHSFRVSCDAVCSVKWFFRQTTIYWHPKIK